MFGPRISDLVSGPGEPDWTSGPTELGEAPSVLLDPTGRGFCDNSKCTFYLGSAHLIASL